MNRIERAAEDCKNISDFKSGYEQGALAFAEWLHNKGYIRSQGMDTYYCGKDTYKTAEQLFQIFKNERV